MAFEVEEIMKSVSDALVFNMKEHPDSILNLDRDFHLELRVSAGEYNRSINEVENREPTEIGIFINIERSMQ